MNDHGTLRVAALAIVFYLWWQTSIPFITHLTLIIAGTHPDVECVRNGVTAACTQPPANSTR